MKPLIFPLLFGVVGVAQAEIHRSSVTVSASVCSMSEQHKWDGNNKYRLIEFEIYEDSGAVKFWNKEVDGQDGWGWKSDPKAIKSNVEVCGKCGLIRIPPKSKSFEELADEAAKETDEKLKPEIDKLLRQEKGITPKDVGE